MYKSGALYKMQPDVENVSNWSKVSNVTKTDPQTQIYTLLQHDVLSCGDLGIR